MLQVLQVMNRDSLERRILICLCEGIPTEALIMLDIKIKGMAGERGEVI